MSRAQRKTVEMEGKTWFYDDPPEQRERCLSCPLPADTKCPDDCWYRLGLDGPRERKPAKKYEAQKPPEGYDREALERALREHGAARKAVAAELGVHHLVLTHWVRWYEQEEKNT